MRIGILGPLGQTGTSIAQEGTHRGHEIAFFDEHLASVVTTTRDSHHQRAEADAIAGFDVVISPDLGAIASARSLLDAVRSAGVGRCVAAGAGLLGRQLLDALGHDELSEWTILQPPERMSHGKRTGTYRLGLADSDLVNDSARAITLEDFAVAIIDEAEDSRHPGGFIAVGY